MFLLRLFFDSCISRIFDSCLRLLFNLRLRLCSDPCLRLFFDSSLRLFSDSCLRLSSYPCLRLFSDSCLRLFFDSCLRRSALRLLSSSTPAPLSLIVAPRSAPICRRSALVAPSLGMFGTSRSSVRFARPTTTTDEDNVGSFGWKEMYERRTESGEGLPLPAASGQRRTSSPTGPLSMSTSGSTSLRLVDIIFSLSIKFAWLVDICRYLNRVGAKQQISANIIGIQMVGHVQPW